MVTLQKSQKYHEKSINTRYFVKNTDFQLLNGFDHVYEVVLKTVSKIVIFRELLDGDSTVEDSQNTM